MFCFFTTGSSESSLAYSPQHCEQRNLHCATNASHRQGSPVHTGADVPLFWRCARVPRGRFTRRPSSISVRCYWPHAFCFTRFCGVLANVTQGTCFNRMYYTSPTRIACAYRFRCTTGFGDVPGFPGAASHGAPVVYPCVTSAHALSCLHDGEISLECALLESKMARSLVIEGT